MGMIATFLCPKPLTLNPHILNTKPPNQAKACKWYLLISWNPLPLNQSVIFSLSYFILNKSSVAKEAARIGRAQQRGTPHLVRPDWDTAKLFVMYAALRAKASPSLALRSASNWSQGEETSCLGMRER